MENRLTTKFCLFYAVNKSREDPIALWVFPPCARGLSVNWRPAFKASAFLFFTDFLDGPVLKNLGMNKSQHLPGLFDSFSF